MTPVQHQFTATAIARCADAAVIALGLWLAYRLYGPENPERYLLACVLALLLYLLIGGGTPAHRYAPHMTLAQAIWSAVGTWIWTLVGLLVIAWMTKATAEYSRVAIGLWAIFGTLGLAAWRVARHAAMRFPAGSRDDPPAVIVGTGPQALSFARFLESSPAFRSDVAGAFTENGAAESEADERSLPVLGDFDALVERAGRREFSAIFIALPANAEDSGRRLVAALSETPATVYVVPSLFTEEFAYAQWVSLGGLPLVSIFESPYVGVNGWVKRVEDLALALAILVVAAAPMLLIAAAVKLTSSGPVLFRQRRHGIDGREIRVLKFCTMTVTEDGDAVRQAVKDDSRVTSIGAFLRHTSLDELPQFFNVLRGDMSVVGPRPHAIAVNDHYRRLIPG